MFGMGPRHSHTWQERERGYAPPAHGSVDGPARLALKAVMGVTTVVFECAGCGELRTVEYLGRKVET